MNWAKHPQGQTVYWLNGLAGTGKSTIAQSFAEMVSKEGILGASFFCSRDYLNRQELKNIFPTLAHQLAYHYPHIRTHIINIIKQDPTIAHSSLISQLENLLVNPLSREGISCIIVVDALDECIDNQPASAILSVLGQFARQLPLVRFFITGRPEPRIRTGFRLPLLEPLTQIFLLHEVESSSVDKDIQLYLTERLTIQLPNKGVMLNFLIHGPTKKTLQPLPKNHLGYSFLLQPWSGSLNQNTMDQTKDFNLFSLK